MPEKLSKNPEEIRAEQTEQEILKEFEVCLKAGNLLLAKRIKERFKNIDFSEIIKAEFERRLQRKEVRDTVILKKELGEGIDFSQAITENAPVIKEEFKILLERYRARQASYIKEEFEQWIDFSEIIIAYSHQIKKEFEYYLMNGTIRNAGRIKRVMGEGMEEELDRIFDGYIANESKFNEVLEKTRSKPLEDIKGLFEFPSLAGKPGEPIEDPWIARRHLYIARMLALCPEEYEDLVNYLEERKIDTQYFKGKKDSRLQEIRNLRDLFNNIGKDKIDVRKLSYNLEIEILNKDRILEIETKITNNYQEILDLVKALDNFNQRLIEDMRALNEEEKIVGVYDSVHINIGIPKKEAANAMAEDIDIKKKMGLFKILDLLGLIYNPLGRSAYMLKTHRYDRIVINREAKHNYPAKLQDRLWCFRFTEKNRPSLVALLIYLTKIISLYCKDPNKAREKAETDATEIAKIIKETNTSYGKLIDQDGTISESEVQALGKPSFFYYPGRNIVLKKVLGYLKKSIKSTEQ